MPEAFIRWKFLARNSVRSAAPVRSNPNGSIESKALKSTTTSGVVPKLLRLHARDKALSAFSSGGSVIVLIKSQSVGMIGNKIPPGPVETARLPRKVRASLRSSDSSESPPQAWQSQLAWNLTAGAWKRFATRVLVNGYFCVAASNKLRGGNSVWPHCVRSPDRSGSENLSPTAKERLPIMTETRDDERPVHGATAEAGMRVDPTAWEQCAAPHYRPNDGLPEGEQGNR